MMWKKEHVVAALGLIAGFALFPSSGLSQERSEVFITEPEFLGVSDQEPVKVSEPESLKISEQKPLKLGYFEKGKYIRPKRDNPAYDRCAKLKGFDEQLQCANEARRRVQEKD